MEGGDPRACRHGRRRIVAKRLRRILERVRLLGLARGLRGVEQTPETSFVLGAVLRAYPEAVAVHVVRDGARRRDVAARARVAERRARRRRRRAARLRPARAVLGRAGARGGVPHGVATRPARAWAWRRYVTAAHAAARADRELRYEQLVADPAAAAVPVAERLGVAVEPRRGGVRARARSLGRALAA